MDDPDHDVECSFCGSVIEGVEAAIEAGWYPSFWVGESEYSSPICEGCAIAHCDFDPEPVVKPGHAGFLATRPE
jgi:hypothetical protein